MNRMKKSVAMFCAISCCAAALASPAFAQSPDSGRTGCRPFYVFSENTCPDFDRLIGLLKNSCPDFSFQFPDCSAPEITPPETEIPDSGNQVPPPEEETPAPSLPDAPEPPAPDRPNDGGSESEGESDGLSDYEKQVVSLVNAERTAAGLSPVRINKQATQAARVRCKEQTVSFSHTRPNGARFSSALDEAGVSYLGAGENIAYGQRSAEEVMKDWMNSSGHRANILREEYTEIGVGCIQDASGILYWTQLFIY